MSKILESALAEISKMSISCFEVPDALLGKTTAKNYFQQFGKVLRIRLRPRQKVCIVEFSNEASAQRAYNESGNFEGEIFRVIWTKYKSEKRKPRKSAVEKDPDWSADPEIKAELEAMRGSFSSNRSNYNLRPEAMVVDDNSRSGSPKRSINLKKSSRQWKTEKPIKSKTSDAPLNISYNMGQVNEHLNTIMKAAVTNEEKYRILEARDKLIRLRTVRQSELARATRTVGTCPDMCPEKERLMREIQHQVAFYEQAGNNKSVMNHTIAVKQYARSSADQEAPLAHELRPVEVLQLTMRYLLHKVMDDCESADVNLGEWYHFVWDRTRGIRKDITQQELCCLRSVELVEQCARFHVHCSARLIAEDVSVFDEKINTENLTKCLQTLKYMYHDLRVKNIACPKEAEFRAYVVLLNLNDANFMWEVQQLSREIQQSPEVRFAIQVYSALDKNNYVKFFKLVRTTSYLNACILLRYFNQVRFRALLTILKSYSPRQPYTQFPLTELCYFLAFEDLDNTIAYLEYCGLQVNAEQTHVLLDRRMFRQPDTPFGLERAINVVESKRNCSVGEVVCGAPLPGKDFEKHITHNSFDDNGHLKLNEVPKQWQGKYQEYLSQLSFQYSKEEEFEKAPATEEPENEIEEINDENYDNKIEDTNNLKSMFTFSQPVVHDFHSKSILPLPNASTSFKFQLPIQKDISEPDGDVNKFRKMKNVIKQNENKSQSSIFSTSKDDQINQIFFEKNTFATSEKSVPKFSYTNIEKSTKEENENSEKNDFKFVPSSTNNSSDSSSSFIFNKTPITEQQFTIEKSLHSNSNSNFSDYFEGNNVCIVQATQITNQYNYEQEEREREEKLKQQKAREEEEEREKRRRELEQIRAAEELRKKRETEEIKKKLEAEKLQAKIKSEVKLILNDILEKVGEIEVKNKLEKISAKIKNRKLQYYAIKWKNITRISKKKRKNFFDNPVWISSRSITKEAEELYTPSQDLTLQNIKRYKLGISGDIQLKETKNIVKLDIFKIAWKILFENVSSNDDLINLNIFWKIGICLSEIKEPCKEFSNLKQSLNMLFNWNEIQSENEIMSLGRIGANNGGTFSYCIKKLTSPENNMNGLLCVNIGDEISKVSIRRFLGLLSENYINTPIPVCVLIKNSNYLNDDLIIEQLKLYKLQNDNIISAFQIFFANDRNLHNILTNCLEFLAKHTQIQHFLEMDALSNLLRNFIGDEFWYKLRANSQINERLEILLRDPDIVINLHNENLHRLIDIIYSEDCLEQPDFPKEFKQFLNLENIILPCTYEYFPDQWKSKTYINKMKKIIESLALPHFNANWPPHNRYLLQEILLQYCEKLFENSTNVTLKILSIILKQIYEDSDIRFEDQIRKISWTYIVQLIIEEKINNLQFNDKSHSVFTVAYKVSDLKEFRNSPWWYQTPIIKDRIKFVELEEIDEPEILVEDDDDIDLDKTMMELDEEIELDKNKEAKNDMKYLSSTIEDLEQSMKIQEKIMSKFQETARLAFDFSK